MAPHHMHGARVKRANTKTVRAVTIRASPLQRYQPVIASDLSWLGTTYYLTRDAVRETLDYVAAVAASGSRIALDYKYPRSLIPDDGMLFADEHELDHVSRAEQEQRYLQGRSDT